MASSIVDNITAGQSLTVEQLKEVVERSGVNEFVQRLPQGLNTVLSENASDISVGQAQRIAVARALAKQGQLLLLDEPTASLDRYHEQQILTTLLAASFTQTTLMVTHQLDGIAEWDEIWVMEKGQIIQSGDYKALANTAGLFQQMLVHRSGDID